MNANGTNMLGIYSLENGAPIDPEIVLANCKDPAMLGQVVQVFQNNGDIRFFLINGIDGDNTDFGNDLYFIKDNGNWILAADNTMIDVRFDDSSFNPTGTESSFSIIQGDDGAFELVLGETITEPEDMLLTDGNDFLIHEGSDEILIEEGGDASPSDNETDTIIIDQSALNGDPSSNMMVIEDYNAGTDSLSMQESMIIKAVNSYCDTKDHIEYTEVMMGDNDGNDTVVRLLGVSRENLEQFSSNVDTDTKADDLIQYMIDSDGGSDF